MPKRGLQVPSMSLSSASRARATTSVVKDFWSISVVPLQIVEADARSATRNLDFIHPQPHTSDTYYVDILASYSISMPLASGFQVIEVAHGSNKLLG